MDERLTLGHTSDVNLTMKMTTKCLVVTLCGIICVTFGFSSFGGAEQLGTLNVSEYFFEFEAKLKEPQAGNTGFNLSESYVGFTWVKDSNLSGKIKLGSQKKIGRPYWMGADVTTLGFFEAYGEYVGGLGEIRAGLIPTGFGLEGRTPDAQLLLPRMKFFTNRWLAQEDFGVSYYLSHNGFYTRATVHNGEAAEDADSRSFLTSLFGWKGGAGFHLGISGTTGRRVDSNRVEHKMRVADAFVDLDVYGLGFTVEGILGETKTSAQAQQFLNWRADIRHPLGERSSIFLRHEQYDPNVFAYLDLEKVWVLGLEFSGEHRSSRLIISAIKNNEEINEVPNDELRVTWRLNSDFTERGY